MKLAGIALLLLLLAACGDPDPAATPEEAATRFLEALQSGDQEDIYAAVLREEGKSFQLVDERMDFNRWDNSNIDEFKISGVEFIGDRAYVKVAVTREIDDNKVETEESVVCLKQDGGWKVAFSSSSKSFLPSGKKPE